MTEVELTGDDLNFFSNFEKITHVMPSDYLATENTLIFLVKMDALGKAIGKGGSNVEKLKRMFRKKVVVVGDSEDPEIFLKSFFGNIHIYNLDMRDVMGEKNYMMIIDEKDRGIAIGRDGERIKAAKTLLKKKFNATVHVRTRRPQIDMEMGGAVQ